MNKKTNGFEKPNHTQTPNSLFDELLSEIDTLAELKFTLAIIRQTIGWHRKRVRFGVGKIERMTGLARNSVLAGADAAEKRGTVIRIKTDGEAEWELIVNDSPSTADPSKFDPPSTAEGNPPQNLTETPSTAEGHKRKKEMKEIIDSANKEVDYILGIEKKVKYENRDKVPEPLLWCCDVYFELTGQQPTKRVLFQWIGDFNDWISEGLQPQDIRDAYKHATRPEGGFLVGRPGSLTNTAVALKAKNKTTNPQNKVQSFIDQIAKDLEVSRVR